LVRKLQGEELVEVATVDLDGRRPVEVLEGDALLEAGSQQAAFELQGIAALDLIGEDEGKEGGVVELLGTSQRPAVGECRDRLAELETLEQGDDVWFKAHPAGSRRRRSKAVPGRAKRLPSGARAFSAGSISRSSA